MCDHWETPYMDISIRHHKNEDRTWYCLSHSDSPAGKAPHQYSEDHQEKWAQSLAHILHCYMQRDLWIEFRICNVQAHNIVLQNGSFSNGSCINEKKVQWSIQAKHQQKDFQFQAVNRNPLCIYSITWRPSGMHLLVLFLVHSTRWHTFQAWRLTSLGYIHLKAQLPAHHKSIIRVPVIMAHSSPHSSNAYLHPPLPLVWSVHKTNITTVARLLGSCT